jgi:predicted RNA-binding protein YlxR (DUF448 family)
MMKKEVAPRKKHTPQRMCVVCRQTSAKRFLTRLVRTANEGVQLDPTGKRSGRGAYLCDQPECWQRALNTDVLAKALRTTLAEEDKQRLREATARISGAAAQKPQPMIP